MQFVPRPAQLFIALVGRHRGEMLVEAAKAAGARGGTIALGRTTGDNPILQALSLADISQDIVFTLMGGEADAVVDAVVSAAAKNPKKLGGLAILLDVPGMMIRMPKEMQDAGTAPAPQARSEKMDSGYELITVIVNNGYADDVMAAARKAGARGGTVLTARGTGTEEDVKFFGIRLVPEKEMLMIVADKGKASDIVDAVNTVPNLCEPGGGIVYTMDVNRFIVLGK